MLGTLAREGLLFSDESKEGPSLISSLRGLSWGPRDPKALKTEQDLSPGALPSLASTLASLPSIRKQRNRGSRKSSLSQHEVTQIRRDGEARGESYTSVTTQTPTEGSALSWQSNKAPSHARPWFLDADKLIRHLLVMSRNSRKVIQTSSAPRATLRWKRRERRMSKFEAGLGYLRLRLKYVYGGGCGSGECQQPGSPSHTFRRFCSPKARPRPLGPLCTPAFRLHSSLPLGEQNLGEGMCTWLTVSEVPWLLGSVISGAHSGTAPWGARANLLTSLQPGKEARMGEGADLLQGHLPCSLLYPRGCVS